MSIETMTVEEFMDGVKAIINKHGRKAPEDIDDMLVDTYNEYRERVRNGETIEELSLFFLKIGEKIGDIIDLEDEKNEVQQVVNETDP